MAQDQGCPRTGQIATLVAVHKMEAEVVGATVLDSKEEHVTLRIEEPRRLERAPLAVGRRVKLLYVGGPVVMRLAGTIESVEPKRAELTLHCTEPPRPGERREYIRAEVLLPLFVQRIPHGEAETTALADPPAPDDEAWAVQLVDLSGSGMKLRYDDLCEPDDVLDVAVRLEARTAEPLRLRGRVVRVLPREKDDEKDVAVQFEGLPLADQDTLINLVFKVRYEALEG